MCFYSNITTFHHHNAFRRAAKGLPFLARRNVSNNDSCGQMEATQAHECVSRRHGGPRLHVASKQPEAAQQ